jgi:hypothetical protein
VCENKGLLPDFPVGFNDDLCLIAPTAPTSST